ncbi:hypothetical protein GGR56DRAFT_646169 [Xylariaceae sp. FL0804]|nr:hypothetical protein GGR56DRAFT_646169 [Xylariaceae sp. FL0804]
MLSNPPMSGLQARQQRQLHRRQNSTPTALETMKIANNENNNINGPLPSSPHHQAQHPQQHRQIHPAPQHRPRVAHRRGMSLDTRRQMQSSPTTTTPLRQEFPMVSNGTTTNSTGFSSTPQQVLREAQQQRMARPGLQQQAAYANLASDENYLISPHTPQMQSFAGPGFEGLPDSQDLQLGFDLFDGPMGALMRKNHEGFGSNGMAQDFDLFPPSNLSTPTFMNFHESPGGPDWVSEGDTASSRRSSRRVSNGIMDRVARFEGMTLEPAQRPLTPPHQNATGYFPLTPMGTPHHGTIRQGQAPQRFAEGYDESTEETVKPTRQSGNKRTKSTFDEMRQAAEAQSMMPTPQRAHTMPQPGPYDSTGLGAPDFLGVNHMSNSSNNNGLRIDTTFDGLPPPSHPLSANSSFSQFSSPVTPDLGAFSSAFEIKAELETPLLEETPQSLVDDDDESPSTEKASRREGSPPPHHHHHHHHRRNESVASLASAASIASIDIEKTRTLTGVTAEDIAQYIRCPDAGGGGAGSSANPRYVCEFEGCGKRFGRKENIKSHVQTHLNDRQYRCPTCRKCFVRQHDLKRHAKIHTGVKPYPCECGNSFARHDALTRHRQRGMCVGAFEGVVRRPVKRGRPRKVRPDIDERRDKANRTRRRAGTGNNNNNAHHPADPSSPTATSAAGSASAWASASSQSGYSDCSAANSPERVHDDGDDALDLLNDLMDVSMGGTTMDPSSLSQGGAHHGSTYASSAASSSFSSSSSSAPMPSLGGPTNMGLGMGMDMADEQLPPPQAMARKASTPSATSPFAASTEPPELELSQSSSPRFLDPSEPTMLSHSSDHHSSAAAALLQHFPGAGGDAADVGIKYEVDDFAGVDMFVNDDGSSDFLFGGSAGGDAVHAYCEQMD